MKSYRSPLFLAALSLSLGLAHAATALSDGDARRLLMQGSFGPTEASVSEAMQLGRAGWLQRQFAQPMSDYTGFAYVDPNTTVGCPTGSPSTCQRDHYTLFPLQLQFFQHALTGPDQLRQRTALALSEILVVSGTKIRLPYAMANYQRIFLTHAFGNFRDVLHDVTLSPAMGAFLNMANNDKPNPAKGIEPNENYARELLQLFSIGLWQLNLDGTPKTGADGKPLPSYNQDNIEGFAHAFTGWTYPQRPGGRNRFPNPSNFASPMVAFAEHHDTAAKTLLNGQTLAAGQSAEADLEAAVSNVFNHPNVGPFIGRQLIQHLVTANPSPAYVARVAAAFNGAGGSPRGDMKATLSAILLDPEASAPAQPASFGKLREPILQLTTLYRSLGGSSDGVWLRSQAANLGQPIFSPPTVFNFFPPDYDLPNDPGLDGPAFGVFNASAAFKLSGVLATALSGTPIAPDASVPGATGTRIDLSRWQALAATPDALVREINRVLFAGRMSSTLGQALLKAAQIAPASKPLDRARAALFLAVMSPEYLVEN
ncbi:DUF1800 domain-containing protein [Paucibacter sp. APW11]|uniref:DUF1800 domain-containing protein n=1 Tax=Roseateles aquae TaxID=3077235 RepID=A0ABU3PCX4_9BURK|nr:DUF1800 domain-containing protein [Paucibacter sp. APW11]MDT9000428.1 DUF1800 domain-containing protein [Paucibacter sp. APW11]